MTAPKIGERHRECANEIGKQFITVNDLPADEFYDLAEIIAKHFPEDDSEAEIVPIDVKLAADRISALSPEVFETIGTYKTVLEIINGCRRGEK